MGCVCMIPDYDGYDPVDDYDIHWTRIGRITDRCVECGTRLRLKQPRFVETFVRKNGTHGRQTLCLTCHEVAETFCCGGRTFGFMWEDFYNVLHEENGEVDFDCLSDLSPEARKEVCAVIDDVWKDLNEAEVRGRLRWRSGEVLDPDDQYLVKRAPRYAVILPYSISHGSNVLREDEWIPLSDILAAIEPGGK